MGTDKPLEPPSDQVRHEPVVVPEAAAESLPIPGIFQACFQLTRADFMVLLSTTVSNGTKTTGKMSHSGGASLGRPGLLAAAAAAGGGGVGALEQLLEVSVLTHAEAVAPDVDDMAVVHEAVDQGAGHDVVAEDLAPILEAFVAREHGGGPLVAAAHELEEEHGAGACDREVAELVDDQERREDERLEPLAEPTRRLGFLERRDEIGEGAVVDAAATLGGGDREADREVGLPHTGRPEEDDVFFALDEAERVQAVELLAFDRRLEAEVEVGERLHGRQTRGAHGGGEPAGIAQRDLRPEERFDRFAGPEPAAIDLGEDAVAG